MGAEVDPYPSRQHPPRSALQCPGKNRTDFLKTSYLFTATLQSPFFSLPLCCIDFLLLFFTPTIPLLGYLSIAFIYSAGRAIQHTFNINIFAWHRKQCLQYIYTSKFGKMLHLRTLVRQSRSECFSLLGCQRQPCEQRAGGFKTDSLAAEDFTMPGFLNFPHPLWFPPFRIPIYPSALKKKRGGVGEVL